MPRNRNNSSDSDNNARLKVVYFEAENVSSDLTGMINAFAAAIRNAPVQVIAPQPPAQIESRRTAPVSNGEEPSREEDQSSDPDTPVSAPSPKPVQPPKKAFKGKILDDIAWDGNGTPFVEYVKQRSSQETTTKFLVIASWFKRFGGHEAVGSNLVYNGYRKLGWGALNDMTQPFRDGAKSERGYYISAGKGLYAITNIGLDAADKAGSEK